MSGTARVTSDQILPRTMQRPSCMLLLAGSLLLATAPNALAGRRLQQDVTTQVVSATGAPCSNLQSPVQPITSGGVFTSEMNATNNIAPNTTGVPAPPLPAPLNAARGTYEVVIDNTGQRASWKLTLCDVPQYIASHLHVGSPAADYPPPLIPLEPYGKPSDPFAPPALLPQLCPALNITGCSYTKEGSFLAADISPLPGRPGDPAVPAVTTWADFVQALQAGNIYINIHSLAAPANLIRGNLRLTQPGATAGTPATTPTGTAVTAPATETPATTTPVVGTPVAEPPTAVRPVEGVPEVATPAAETPTAAIPAVLTPVAETTTPPAPAAETTFTEAPAAPAAETTATAAPVSAPAAETGTAAAPAAEITGTAAPAAEATPAPETPEAILVVPVVVAPASETSVTGTATPPAAETSVTGTTAAPAAETGPTGATGTTPAGATAGTTDAVIDGLIGDATAGDNVTTTAGDGTTGTTGA